MFTTKNDVHNIKFIQQIKTTWLERHSECDVFRYKVDNLCERKVDEKYIIQLNPDRCFKRRTPELIGNICQPFDHNKFNFTKVSTKEVLLKLNDDKNDTHAFIVNVSPLSLYHSLLCPSVNKCLPQVITEESLILALEVKMYAEDWDLRIGFNSLCALASVNHLHYHLLFIDSVLPAEKAPNTKIKGPLYILNGYTAPAFCFLITSRDKIAEVAKDVYKLIAHLLSKSIAHNVLIANGSTMGQCKVIVWPRVSSVGVKEKTSFNVAVLELSGWFSVHDPEDYEKLTSTDLENELKKWKYSNFDSLCDDVSSLF